MAVFRKRASVSLTHSLSMFQPSLTSNHNNSNSSLNQYKPPLFTSSCNSISEEAKSTEEKSGKSRSQRQANRRKSSLASQASQASCDRSEREDIAALLGKTQSVKKKPLISRKSIGFGERFSSLVSISSQVAQTMMGVSELGWPLSSEQIDPNELVDKLLNEIILTASQNQLQSLPDMKVSGIVLSEGKLAGLGNFCRYGNADIDIKSEKLILTFCASLNDLLATYSWKRKKIKGLIKAGLCKTFLHIKIRHKIKNTNPELLDASLGSLETVQVTVRGLGPVNLIARHFVKDLVISNIRGLVESQARNVIKSSLENFSLLEHHGYVGHQPPLRTDSFKKN